MSNLRVIVPNEKRAGLEMQYHRPKYLNIKEKQMTENKQPTIRELAEEELQAEFKKQRIEAMKKALEDLNLAERNLEKAVKRIKQIEEADTLDKWDSRVYIPSNYRNESF